MRKIKLVLCLKDYMYVAFGPANWKSLELSQIALKLLFSGLKTALCDVIVQNRQMQGTFERFNRLVNNKQAATASITCENFVLSAKTSGHVT